jgi:hypothetical protein
MQSATCLCCIRFPRFIPLILLIHRANRLKKAGATQADMKTSLYRTRHQPMETDADRSIETRAEQRKKRRQRDGKRNRAKLRRKLKWMLVSRRLSNQALTPPCQSLFAPETPGAELRSSLWDRLGRSGGWWPHQPPFHFWQPQIVDCQARASPPIAPSWLFSGSAFLTFATIAIC